MEVGEVHLDGKAKRVRNLLTGFYSSDNSVDSHLPLNSLTLDTLNSSSFDLDQYMNLLVRKSNLEDLLGRHVELASEIKNIDTDLQMLVYENYNKFISATDTIKRMKNNIVGMEKNMEQLLKKIKSVQSRSDGVDTSLSEKREEIEKVHRTRNLLQKIQLIYDLPATLENCIKSEAYSEAVRLYTGAVPIFMAYGESSFKDYKKASEEAVSVIAKELQVKLFSDHESLQIRAEAALLLKQLDFPVESLKGQLLDRLEGVLVRIEPNNVDGDASSEAVFHEFVQAFRAYRVIFPDSEKRLVELSQDLVTRYLQSVEHKRNGSTNLLKWLAFIWKNVLTIDEVLPEADLSKFTVEGSKMAVRDYISSSFSDLLSDIAGDIQRKRAGSREESAAYAVKRILLQGIIDTLQDLQQLLSDDDSSVVHLLRTSVAGWIPEGLHRFFLNLNDRFLQVAEDADTVLLLSHLSVFLQQTVVHRVSEEVAEMTPGLVASEICGVFRLTGEALLHHYVMMKSRKLSLLLRKRFMTPNWLQHKEPRGVHMFVDLFLREVDDMAGEVKETVVPGNQRRHRPSASNGSSVSSLGSNPFRDELHFQGARNQFLETHLAKLFKQKVDIFTKLEFTQESVIAMVVKLGLKSLQEYVRLQTFNRRGFQQIQLDVQYMRDPLKETLQDRAAVDFLLDEVIISASERCLDPVPLAPPIIDRLIQSKLPG